jgi:hypothetical protein
LFVEFVLVIVDVYNSREGALVAVQGRVVVSRRDVKLHTRVGVRYSMHSWFYHILENLLDPAGLKL